MTTDVTLYENHTDHYYDLIFTPAGDVIGTDGVGCDKCDCGDCGDCNDWISGDIVQW
jgi:hypothetical protein